MTSPSVHLVSSSAEVLSGILLGGTVTLGKLVIVVSLAVFLQGCWFIYIPAGTFSAIGDAFTGGRDVCVNRNYSVGNNITHEGELYEIKSLSGTSSRCAVPSNPILARVVRVD